MAFSQKEGEFSKISPELLGDIVISVETALREAKEQNITLEKEMDILLVHGILHLLGYEHIFGGLKAKKMKERELQLVKFLENNG